MFREVPSLSITCLKLISKSPNSYISEKSYEKILKLYSKQLIMKATQHLINYITEVGRMSDFIIPLIAFHNEYHTLSLKNSKITGNYLISIIQRSSFLEIIDVSGCLMIDDYVINQILSICLLLKTIEIRNCRKLTDLSIQYLNELGSNLVNINIGGNFNITEAGVLQLIQEHPNRHSFQSLNISGLPITEGTLESLSLHCTTLKYLGIGYAIISEISIRKYLEISGMRLECLILSWITPPLGYLDSLSFDLLDYIARTCPKLHTLDISGLKNMSYNAILSFIETKRAKVSQKNIFFSSFLFIFNFFYKADYNPQENERMKYIIAKFTAGTRTQLEALASQYPELTIEA